MNNVITKKLNAVVANGVVRIEIPLPVLRKILGYYKKTNDSANIIDEVRGIWRDRKGIDGLVYQKKLRDEWR